MLYISIQQKFAAEFFIKFATHTHNSKNEMIEEGNYLVHTQQWETIHDLSCEKWRQILDKNQ